MVDGEPIQIKIRAQDGVRGGMGAVLVGPVRRDG